MYIYIFYIYIYTHKKKWVGYLPVPNPTAATGYLRLTPRESSFCLFQHIRLRASVFSIEQSTGCEYDHLQVYDGKNASAPSLARLCGSTFPAHGLNSTGPLMFLKFVSDKSVSKRGFRLLYSTWWQGSGSPAVAPSHTPTPSPTPDGSSPAPCGGQLSVTPGTFSSPNFGSNQTYPYSTTCQWLIDAGPDNVS